MHALTAKAATTQRPPIRQVRSRARARFLRMKIRLVMAGYEVLTAADEEAALDIFHRCAPNLVILDVLLSKGDGYSVCKAIRSVSDVPIIMLTALADLAERIAGLEAGADDYIVKPFSVRELEARIQTILRRFQTSSPHESDAPKVICVRELRIDDNKRQVYKGEQPVHLTELEFKLLKQLASCSGVAVPRNQLLQEIWGYSSGGFFDTRVVDVHVSRLRNKIETDPKNPEYILTVRGEGYMLLGADGEDG